MRRTVTPRRAAVVAAVVSATLAVVALLASSSAGTLSRHLRPATASPGYLLALGDSLASGYQPTDGNAPPPVDPATGYPDEGYPGGYAADLASAEHLRLVDLACPGETTASMSSVPAEARCGDVYRAEFSAPSQLGAALRFLSRHRHEVRLVTIDIGANDIEHCVSGGAPNPACLRRGIRSVVRQLPALLARIRHALTFDDTSATFVGMNYYDPFLGLDFRPRGTVERAEAFLSLVLVEEYDAQLGAAYASQHVRVADVAAAFDSASTRPATYDSDRLPGNVAMICRLTWMCPPPWEAEPRDIHANTSGYRVIAEAFERVLRGP